MQLNNLLSDERGVSPVIGVILMVAITVILAAVIGTMVLGLTDGVGQNVQAGANINDDTTNDRITVSYNSNQNAEYLNVSVMNDSDDAVYRLQSPGDKVILTTDGNTTSSGVTVTGDAFNNTNPIIKDGTYTVTVTAVKGDTTTVIAEETVEL